MGSILQGRRLVIAHNPHSSRAADVQTQVFDRLDHAGYAYDTIEVQQAHLTDNVTRLAPQIKPNDIILSAAGDGSAHAVFHTVVAANQPGTLLGFLAFGNFNDIPHTFNDVESLRDPVDFLERCRPEKVWPLEVLVDDMPLRNALLYVTIGWTAQAASQFDNPDVRSKITHGGAGVYKSIWRLGLYYLKTRRSSVLPAFMQNDVSYKKTTDLIFANGPTVARLFRSGKRYYRENVFLYRKLDVRRLISNMPFLVSGLLGHMKGEEITDAFITFDIPSKAPIQCDGEVVLLENSSSIWVRKANAPLIILATM